MDFPILDRVFRGDVRHKVVFHGNAEPLYTFMDNTGAFNVDTRYVLPPLKRWIGERLGAMRTATYATLTDREREAYDIVALYTADVVLTFRDNCTPVIQLEFDNYVECLTLHGTLDRIHIIYADEVADDFLSVALQFQK
jgi:hypothetical protein